MTGVRTSKTVGSVTHNYIYASGKLIRETYGSTTLDFLYDQNGNPFAMNYTVGNTTTTYYYILNLQGDVVRVVNASGVTVGTYSYDAWGKVTVNYGSVSNATTITDANPLRYRGYVYDTDTGFYYLQSRYYDPQIGRFINADSYASTGQGFLGYNMFAYCRNNPVCRKDATGTEDVCVTNIDDDNNPLNDLGKSPSGGSSGGSIWSSFTRTLKYASDGLKMASGQRDLTHKEKHHLISNKHKTKYIECKEIADRYNYSLNHKSNIVLLQGHRGGHTNAYQDFITVAIKELDIIAEGSLDTFIEGMQILGEFIKENWWIPYAQYK